MVLPAGCVACTISTGSSNSAISICTCPVPAITASAAISFRKARLTPTHLLRQRLRLAASAFACLLFTEGAKTGGERPGAQSSTQLSGGLAGRAVEQAVERRLSNPAGSSPCSASPRRHHRLLHCRPRCLHRRYRLLRCCATRQRSRGIAIIAGSGSSSSSASSGVIFATISPPLCGSFPPSPLAASV